ncbi:MAG: efflux RND transporter periplasmic adaptor subunit [Flavobacteriales bacterium]|nr:efflux RND transporter periplasmic adaptor subunit [Flavobacteriales bacterium]
MKSKKWIIILLAAAALLIVMGVLKGGSSNKSIEVTSEKVTKRTIVETVAASGKIQPETEVVISSDVSGEIIEMAVLEGDLVKKGDLLLKINPDLVESALSRAEAALNTTRANLAGTRARLAQSKSQFVNAKATFERNEKLYKDNVISQSEFDNAKASYEVASADVNAAEESVQAGIFNVKSSEATLKEARENLGRTSIYSPMDGTITKLNKEKGERVVGTAQMAGTEILTVADLSVMEVAVEVNENDIVRVNIGDTTEIEVDAYLGKKFKGLVTEIANSANILGTSADQVTNFDVKIRILPSSYKKLMDGKDVNFSPFRPGMSATVDIRTTEATDVLTLPIQAVTTRAEKDTSEAKTRKTSLAGEKDDEELKECVFIVDGDVVKQVYVETGIQNTMHIEITSGLTEGDEVVSGPYTSISKKLKDGDKIEVVTKDKLFSKEKD